MKLYAFSDFHLSGDPPTKPMDIFGENWKNHREKIVNAWKETIREDDAVIMAGDLSWAMSMESAISDLTMLGTLPGRKIIVRGNHDFWWSTVTKMTAMTHGAFEFIHNSAIQVGNVALAGTRGWISETAKTYKEDTDKSIILREEGRMERSLALAKQMKAARIIAILHYPPFDEMRRPSHMMEIIAAGGADLCLYGHIHGAPNFKNLPDSLLGVPLCLTSSDYLDFKPYFICDLEAPHA